MKCFRKFNYFVDIMKRKKRKIEKAQRERMIQKRSLLSLLSALEGTSRNWLLNLIIILGCFNFLCDAQSYNNKIQQKVSLPIDYSCGLRRNSQISNVELLKTVNLKSAYSRQSIDNDAWSWFGYVFNQSTKQVKCTVALITCNTVITSQSCDAELGDLMLIGGHFRSEIAGTRNSDDSNMKILQFEPPIYIDDQKLVERSINPICVSESPLLTVDCKLLRAPLLSSKIWQDFHRNSSPASSNVDLPENLIKNLLPLETDLSHLANPICEIFLPDKLEKNEECFTETFDASKHFGDQNIDPKIVNCDSNGLVFCKRNNLGALLSTEANDMWYLTGIVDFRSVCRDMIFNSLRMNTPEMTTDIQKTSFKLKSRTQSKPCCSEKYLKKEVLQQRAPIIRNNYGDDDLENQNNLILLQKKNPNIEEKTHEKITYIAPNRCCSTKNYNFFDESNDEKYCCGGTLIDKAKGQDCCFGVAFNVFEHTCEMDSGYLSRN